VKQAGKAEVVDVTRAAGDLVSAFLAENVSSDGPERPRHLRII